MKPYRRYPPEGPGLRWLIRLMWVVIVLCAVVAIVR